MDKVNMCQIQKQIDNSKEEMMGVISFILAIFPLSFVINSYLVAMKNIGENQGTENIRTIFFYVLIFLIIPLHSLLHFAEQPPLQFRNISIGSLTSDASSLCAKQNSFSNSSSIILDIFLSTQVF